MADERERVLTLRRVGEQLANKRVRVFNLVLEQKTL